MIKELYQLTNRNLIIFIIVALSAFMTAASGKIKVVEGVNMEAEFRPRLEIDGRDFSSDTGYDAYSTFRTRIGLELNGLIEKTVLYIMVGDSRTMGYSNPYLTGNPVGPNKFDNNLGVVKAYMEVHDLFTEGFYLGIGRMSNDQGRYRLFGPGDWNFYGPRTYDGMKLGYNNGDFSLNAWNFFGAGGDRHWYPSENDPSAVPNPEIDYKHDHTLTGLDLSLFDNGINLLSYLDLDQNLVADTLNDQRHVAVSRVTTAFNTHQDWGNRKQFWGDLDVAYQFGTMGHAAGQADISAYLFAGDCGWRVEEQYKTWIGLGFHILSGDDGTDQDKVTYFYDKYCSKHQVLGHMDFFESDTGTKSRGIRDLILRCGITPFTALRCQIDIHHFAVEKPYPSAFDGSRTHNLGQEVDATFVYSIHKGLKSTLGVDLFFPSEDWQGSGSDAATFIYLVLHATI